jgi:hypothetical protein
MQGFIQKTKIALKKPSTCEKVRHPRFPAKPYPERLFGQQAFRRRVSGPGLSITK